MSVTDGKIKFVKGVNDIEISMPSYDYETTVVFPWDITKLENGHISIYDNGAIYDKRKCTCLVYMEANELALFNRFVNFNSNDSKASDLVLQMNTNSGFFPFGADKGDVGDFEVALQIKNHGRVGDVPFRYFVVELTMHNVGVYPNYTLPTNRPEGNFSFGNVGECRFPSGWFVPAVKFSNYLTIDQGSRSNWIDRGSEGDSYLTEFTFELDNPKASRVIKEISETIRAENFIVVPPELGYMFGRDKVNISGFLVKMATNTLAITHSRKSLFTIETKLSYVSDYNP